MKGGVKMPRGKKETKVKGLGEKGERGIKMHRGGWYGGNMPKVHYIVFLVKSSIVYNEHMLIKTTFKKR